MTWTGLAFSSPKVTSCPIPESTNWTINKRFLMSWNSKMPKLMALSMVSKDLSHAGNSKTMKKSKTENSKTKKSKRLPIIKTWMILDLIVASSHSEVFRIKYHFSNQCPPLRISASQIPWIKIFRDWTSSTRTKCESSSTNKFWRKSDWLEA